MLSEVIQLKLMIISVQYSPIFKSESFALGKAAEQMGFSVSYLLSNEFRWMLSNDEISKCEFIGQSKNAITILLDALNIFNYIKILLKIIKEKPKVIYSSNFHPFFNIWILILSKIMDINYIHHIHEPYTQDKSVYEFVHQLYLIVFELLQGFVIKGSNNLILSSDEAEKAFKQKYGQRNINYVRMPLLFENIIDDVNPKENRKFITFIGPPSKAKNFEKFIEISNRVTPALNDYIFLLITREPLDESQKERSKRITVFCKKQISDEEFFNLLSKSIVVVAPYLAVRQSSTVLTSYMCGTPVLTSDVEGFREVVIDNETGIMKNNQESTESWISSIETIINDFEHFSSNSRNEFINKYSSKNWNNYLNALLNYE